MNHCTWKRKNFLLAFKRHEFERNFCTSACIVYNLHAPCALHNTKRSTVTTKINQNIWRQRNGNQMHSQSIFVCVSRHFFSHSQRQFYSKLSAIKLFRFCAAKAIRNPRKSIGKYILVERLSLQVQLWKLCIVILSLDILVVRYDARAWKALLQQSANAKTSLSLTHPIEKFDTLWTFFFHSSEIWLFHLMVYTRE